MIRIVEIMIHEPVDGGIRYDIHLGIVEFRYVREHYTGTVRLDTVFEKFFHIVDEFLHRYLLVGVVASYIYTHK